MNETTPTRAGITLRSAWVVVALLWFALLINYVDRQDVFSIFPILQRDLHFSNKQLGLVGSVFAFVYAVCMPFAGRAGDIFRRVNVVVASMVLWSLATLGTSLSRTPSSFIGWRAVMGVVEALYMPAALAIIADFHSDRTRSKAMGIHGTAQFTGIVLGGWFGGWAAEHLGWRHGFAGLAIIGIAYAIFFSRVLPDPPEPLVKARASSRAPFSIFSSRCYLAMIFAMFTFCLILWILYGWLPDVIYEKFHLSLAASGVNATLYLQASSVVGILIGGITADQAKRRIPQARFYVSAFGCLLCGPFAYLTLAVDSLAGLKIASTLFGLFAGCMISNIFASAYDVVAEANYGFAAGVLNLVGGLSGSAGMLLGGWWKGSVGIVTLMKWAVVAAEFAAILLMVVAATQFRSDVKRLG
jgi:MFS family permease